MPDDVALHATNGPLLAGFRVRDDRVERLSWPPPSQDAQGWDWLHLDRTHTETEPYLRHTLGLPEQVVDGLLDTETRPRLTRTAEGLLLILRGINFNMGYPPENMVALRVWITPRTVVTLRRLPVLSVHALQEAYERGEGSRTVGTFLVDLIEHVVDQVDGVVGDTMEEIDALEENVLEHGGGADVSRRLPDLRRRLVRLRRYLAPQRDALNALGRSGGDVLSETDRLDLNESAEQCQRYVEEMESARERAVILQDELNHQADARVSRHSYILSIAAGVFLPITFLTGLLGINVGGIPGANDPQGFWIVVGLCVVIAIAAVGFLIGRRWV